MVGELLSSNESQSFGRAKPLHAGVVFDLNSIHNPQPACRIQPTGAERQGQSTFAGGAHGPGFPFVLLAVVYSSLGLGLPVYISHFAGNICQKFNILHSYVFIAYHVFIMTSPCLPCTL